MVRKVTRFALAGAFLMIAAPAFAQVPPQINPLGIDLDPLHLFSSPAPTAEPGARSPMKKHRAFRKKMKAKKMMMKK